MLEEARQYNEELLRRGTQITMLNEDEMGHYNELLAVSDTGIMGYVNIPAIDVYLPIYHGTEEKTLQVGTGHLAGSSLPVGGIGTHSVITGHTGLPSATLFTNLDKLQKGDIFTITILKETLTYEVDRMSVINPMELDNLAIDREQDYCTLLTCTPYGANTKRLLVRGHRIPNIKEADGSEAVEIHQPTFLDWLVVHKDTVIPIAGASIAALAIICIIVKYNRRPRREIYVGKHVR